MAAIVVRIQRGVTMHGISLTCNSSLDGFNAIVPCGIRDAGVTTLSRELGREVTVDQVRPLAADAIARALDGALKVADHTISHCVKTSAECPEPLPASTTDQLPVVPRTVPAKAE